MAPVMRYLSNMFGRRVTGCALSNLYSESPALEITARQVRHTAVFLATRDLLLLLISSNGNVEFEEFGPLRYLGGARLCAKISLAYISTLTSTSCHGSLSCRNFPKPANKCKCMQ